MSLRLDRFLTLYFFGPLSRFRKPKGLRIPILMYHSISDERETRHPYYWINTSPARFTEHMKYLHDNNYQVIPLSAAVDLICSQNGNGPVVQPASGPASQWPSQPVGPVTPQPATRNPQPSVLSTPNTQDPRPEVLNLQPATCNMERVVLSTPDTRHPTPRYVVLTFDDGYLDFYTHAFPILKLYGFTATVFLPTAYIDGKRPGIRDKEHLNWDRVRELNSAGIDFGSHTVNHPKLHELEWKTIREELDRSRAVIAESIGHCDGFCFPYSFQESDPSFVRRLGVMLENSHFSFCLSTRIGTSNSVSDLLALRRIPVNSADDLAMLEAKLAGGYDWLASVQVFSKCAMCVPWREMKFHTRS